MQEVIAKIGKGQKTWKDLTWDEAKQAMRDLIEGRATPVQVGAFLLAMRLKIESVTELAAFTSAAREYASPLRIATPQPLLDLPTYAGKQDTFHALIGAAVVAAASGVAVLMHGYDGIPGRTGTASILNKLGVPVDLRPQQAAVEATAKGFGYLDIALYHPPLARLLDLRRELGVRSFVHPVAKLLNPARAPIQVIGLTHPPYVDKMAEALKMLGGRRALIVRGVEGDPELSIAAATKVLDVQVDRVFALTLAPKDVGVPAGSFREMAAPIPAQIEQEAALLKSILENRVQGAPRNWVVQNAAMLLYAAGRTSSISAGVPIAAHTIDTGAAAAKLQEVASAEPVGAHHGSDSSPL